ncbi:lysophospholipid acyltransferase family protein [candidate division KSB1 bacterium]|nr:lysophospholipid acyltransferase family protein [candidate division KSB1 bacterium]
MRWYKRLQSYIEYFFVRMLLLPLRLMPPAFLLSTARGFGRFVYFAVPIRKKVALDNLRRSFPEKSEKEIRRIAQAAYIQFSQTAFEFAHLGKMTPDQLAKWVRFEQPELLQELYSMGRGTVCISGHFGNWEYLGAGIRALGFPMVAVAKEQRNYLVDRLINDTRSKHGIETIQLGMALRGVLRSLGQNKFVALLADQDAHQEGLFVQFLGRLSSTASGPAAFALKTGAPVLFGVAVRDEKGNHVIHLHRIQTDDLQELNDHTLKVLTQRHASMLEAFVRKYPEHWFWMHKRWKTKARTSES